MINEFSRMELLIGKDCVESLKEKTVLVFGVGGVGSHCIEALARSGIGHLILVDNDTVSLTNINRQSIAYHSTIGQYKTRVMKERIQDICPKTEVTVHETFVLEENAAELLDGNIDYIVDAIDTVTAKLAIILWTPLIRFPQNWHWCKQPMKKRFLSSAVWEREISFIRNYLKLQILQRHLSARSVR